MNPAPVRAVIIGAGARTLGRHLPHLLDPANATTVVGIYDPQVAASSRAVERSAAAGHPAVAVRTLDALLGLGADVALVASPSAAHFAQTMTLVSRGVHALVEKPLTTTRAEAEALATAAARGAVVVMCSLQGALSNERIKARALIRASAGALSVRGFVQGNWIAAHRGTWRTEQSAGGGFLLDSGSHLLQAALDLAGEVRWADARVRHQGGVEIEGAALLEFASGAVGSLSWCGRTGAATAGEIEVICANRSIRTGIWGHALEVDDGLGAVPFRAGPYVSTWAAFVAAVRCATAPAPTTPRAWVEIAALYEAILESARRYAPVAVGRACVPVDPVANADTATS